MYLIAIFEKKIKDLDIVPEEETAIYDMFADDIAMFLEEHNEYYTGKTIKVPFRTSEMVGVELHKL